MSNNTNQQHFQHLHKFHLTNKQTKSQQSSSTVSSLPIDLMEISLPFPPVISASEIAHKRIRSKICQKSPNAFFVYRKAFVDHLSKLRHKLKMTDVSKLVSHHWKCETTEVKLVYENIAKEVEKELNNIRNKDLVYEDIHEKCRRKRNKQNGKNERKSRNDNAFVNFDAGANLVTTLDFSIDNSPSQPKSDSSKSSSPPSSSPSLSPSSKFLEGTKGSSNNNVQLGVDNFQPVNILEVPAYLEDPGHVQISTEPNFNNYCVQPTYENINEDVFSSNYLYPSSLFDIYSYDNSAASSGSSPTISDVSENPLSFEIPDNEDNCMKHVEDFYNFF